MRPFLSRLDELETLAPDDDCPADARLSVPVGDLRDLIALIAVARAHWAVRVLDAWAELTHSLNWATWPACGPNGYACCLTFIDDKTRDYYGPTPDAARLAAAEAVFPTLPAALRAELGERP